MIIWIAHIYKEDLPIDWKILFLKDNSIPIITPLINANSILFLIIIDIMKTCS